MKSRKLTGWTNVNPVDKDALDRKMVRVCGELRHTRCEKDGKCYLMRPQCEADKLRMVGKKVFSMTRPRVTSADLQKIERILQAAYRKCHRVEVTVREKP